MLDCPPIAGQGRTRRSAIELDEVAERYSAALRPAWTSQFALTGMDTVGVPVWQVFWASEDRSSQSGGIGYGSSIAQARVGALGELAEQVLTARGQTGRATEDGSYAQLRKVHGEDGVVDPRLLGLPAGVAYDDDRPLRWQLLRRLADGAPVLVPAEFVASSSSTLPAPPAYGWLTVPVTNGMGAGTDLDRAVSHALLEILQRDGNGLSFRALDRGVVLDLDADLEPATRDALQKLRDVGIDVMVKLASSEFGVANVYVTGMAPDDDVMAATACGEAAHPDRDVALSKAVLEFASARARKRFMHGRLDRVAQVAPADYLPTVLPLMAPADEEPRVLDATVDWLRAPRDRWLPSLERTIFSRRSRVPFSGMPVAEPYADSAALLADVQRRLADEGMNVLVADLSPADSGVHAVKVVVPGTEVETVAYGRIGERGVRKLLESEDADLVRIGPGPAGWARCHLTVEAEERLGGPAWLDRAGLDRRAAGLLPLYREPSRHTAQQVLQRDRP